jgi:hypothetical protein
LDSSKEIKKKIRLQTENKEEIGGNIVKKKKIEPKKQMQVFLELPNSNKLKETQISEENNVNKGDTLNFRSFKLQ